MQANEGGAHRRAGEGEIEASVSPCSADWTVPTGGGSLLGAKTYFRTKIVDGHTTREETTLDLYHAPTG